MAVTTQEDTRDDLERKSKKRKSDALGDDGSIQIDDEGNRKKKKKKLVDQNASEVVTDVDSTFGSHNSFKKEKEGKRTDGIKEKDEVTDRKREKKKKKNKTGDVGEALQAENISEEIEPMEDSNKKKKKKKKKAAEDGGGADDVSEEVETVEDRKREKKKKAEDEVNDGRREKMKKKKKNRDEVGVSRAEDVSEEVDTTGDRKREKKKKEKKKKKAEDKVNGSERKETPVRSLPDHHTVSDENQNKKTKSVKVKERETKKKHDSRVGSLDEELVTNTNVPSISDGKSSKDRISKKKKKVIGSNTEGEGRTGALKSNKRKNPIESSERSTPGKKSKVVRFSDQVEFLSLADNSPGTEKLKDHSKGKKKVGRLRRGKVSSQAEDEIVEDSEVNPKKKTKKVKKKYPTKVDDGLIRGKRFTKEEDEIVKNSVLSYIENNQLGEKGLEMVLKCSQYPEVKGCWKKIGEALPLRPYWSVYNRAHILFERSESRQWTPEEIELVKEFHKKHGPDWKTLAEELGKHRIHVKDTWRRIRYTNMKKGQWSQDEYESLFDLVNTDLRLKAFEERKSQHGMLRDNIGWEAVGDKLPTRGYALCCQKWYDQLTSPMVAEGIWADADDYRLIMALDELDAACIEDVDWDYLLEHRSGDVCRKRWHQMVRYIGEHGTKSFGEQLEILSQRYCPDVLDAREIYDSKTPIDL